MLPERASGCHAFFPFFCQEIGSPAVAGLKSRFVKSRSFIGRSQLPVFVDVSFGGKAKMKGLAKSGKRMSPCKKTTEIISAACSLKAEAMRGALRVAFLASPFGQRERTKVRGWTPQLSVALINPHPPLSLRKGEADLCSGVFIHLTLELTIELRLTSAGIFSLRRRSGGNSYCGSHPSAAREERARVNTG